jgi:hypothetical protein
VPRALSFVRTASPAACLVALACSGSTPTAPPATPPPQSNTFALSGRVSDADTGAPLATVTIAILDGANASRSAASDAGGAFRLNDLRLGGFTVRARHDGYDPVFRGITLVADTSVDIQMRKAKQSLAGTWTGTLSFTPATGARQDVDIPQLTLLHVGDTISSSFLTAGPYVGSFSGTLRDPASIGSSTGVAGTMTLTINQSGRNPTTCRGEAGFTGTIDWTRAMTSTPQIAFECGTTFTNVTMSLVRQQ